MNSREQEGANRGYSKKTIVKQLRGSMSLPDDNNCSGFLVSMDFMGFRKRNLICLMQIKCIVICADSLTPSIQYLQKWMFTT